jgi:hypothetical protein
VAGLPRVCLGETFPCGLPAHAEGGTDLIPRPPCVAGTAHKVTLELVERGGNLGALAETVQRSLIPVAHRLDRHVATTALDNSRGFRPMVNLLSGNPDKTVAALGRRR